MKPFYPFLLILLWCSGAVGQNLVPNPSFEVYANCPVTTGLIEWSYPWQNILGSCDYYHECGTNGFSIPINRGGGGYPRTGSAYGQFNAWSKTLELREFMGVELMTSLHEGVTYRLRLFLSLQDSVNYAVRNVGAHFSTQPHPQDLTALLSLEPQVRYEGETFLDDKSSWMQVSGTFTAQGGERYLAIGNFDDDTHTDTMTVPNGGSLVNHPEGYWDVAGYFIDDVSVVPDSIYLSNEELGIRNDELEVYPNPATDRITVSLGTAAPQTNATTLAVTDMLGRRIYLQTLKQVQGDGAVAIEVSSWPSGVYVVQVMDGSGNVRSAKFLRR